MYVAARRMIDIIRWRIQKCERGELSGRAVDRIEDKIEAAERHLQYDEHSEAIRELTTAAISLGQWIQSDV
jgi:hypothetical protein